MCVTAFAADEPPALTVNSVWLNGDTLNIVVENAIDGSEQTLQLDIREYVRSNDEYIEIQAVDASGNKSNSIEIKNPYYEPSTAAVTVPAENPENPQKTEITESAVDADGEKPLTPEGTGTVADNVTDADGKEFFTVTTVDGNVFYMIIDRQRISDNVYLLNAVTEDDLRSLAKEGNGITESAVPTDAPIATPAVISTPEPTPEAPASAEPENSPLPEVIVEPAVAKSNFSTIILVVLAIALGVGGYYFKVIRPRNNEKDNFVNDDENYEEADEDENENDEKKEEIVQQSSDLDEDETEEPPPDKSDEKETEKSQIEVPPDIEIVEDEVEDAE
jgi:hypothetical protein